MLVEVKNIVVPSYLRGEDNPYPQLSFGDNKREVYPYSFQDDVDTELLKKEFVEKENYRVICISNGLLEAMILPDMNGRVYSLKNVNTGREIFYRNNVVKPGLVALRGAWISGGIEFNTPSLGHSVSSVSPVFWDIVDNENEVGVIVGSIDRSTRLNWEVKISLKSGRAALDIQTSISNPNHYRERLYYWENCAVPANDDLRFICNGEWVCGKNIKPWPKRDGIDYSQHINNLLPVDHFGYRSGTDFFGAYYSDRRLGTYHLGLRSGTAGQKYFSWGTNEDNKIWEKSLTDDDGQYIELQSGLFESQHISSWLEASESVSVSGSWFGTDHTGEVIWANNILAIAVEKDEKKIILEFIPIELNAQCYIDICFLNGPRNSTEIFLNSGKNSRIELNNHGDFKIIVRNNKKEIILQEVFETSKKGSDGEKPVNWLFEKSVNSNIRAVEDEMKYHCWTKAMNLVEKIAGVDNQVNKHLLLAEMYFKTHQLGEARESLEAVLKAAPESIRAHQLAAAVLLREYRVAKNEELPWQIIDHCQMTRCNGVLSAAGLQIWGEIALLQGHLIEAKDIYEKLCRNNSKNLNSSILSGLYRKLNCKQLAESTIEQIPVWGIYKESEEFLLSGDDKGLLKSLPRKNTVHADVIDYLENAVECLLLYWRLEWFADLNLLLDKLLEVYPVFDRHPVIHLLYADVLKSSCRMEALRKAEKCSVLYISPVRWEECVLFESGLKATDNGNPVFKYLLALFKFQNNQVKEAVCLLKSCLKNTDNVELSRMVLYSLAQWDRWSGNCKDEVKHLSLMLSNGSFDWRMFVLLDESLHKQNLIAPREKLFDNMPEECLERGSIAYAYARLLADLGDTEKAIKILQTREFSQFEGQTNVRRLYVDCLLLSGMKMLINGMYENAVKQLKYIFEFPENIGSASYLGEHGRLACFLLGVISRKNNNLKEAEVYWTEVLDSTEGDSYNGAAFDNKRKERSDETAAVIFAASLLGKKKIFKDYEKQVFELAKESTGADGIAFAAVKHLIKGNVSEAEQIVKKGLNIYCCSKTLKIFELLVIILPIKQKCIQRIKQQESVMLT